MGGEFLLCLRNGIFTSLRRANVYWDGTLN